MSPLNRRRKGGKWGHLSRWHPHPAPLRTCNPNTTIFDHALPDFTGSVCCLCVVESARFGLDLARFMCGLKKSEQKRADKKEQILLTELGCEFLNRRRCSQPDRQSLSSLRCFHSIYSTNDPITFSTLSFCFSITTSRLRGATEEA